MIISKIKQTLKSAKREIELAIMKMKHRDNRNLISWINKWRKHPYCRWAMDERDLFRLYDYMITTSPKVCVEFGTASGYSTVVMGYALQKLGAGKVISFEQDYDLFNFAKNHSPKELDSYIDYVLAPISIIENQYGTYLGYKYEFTDSIDFAVIDGPVGFVWVNERKGKFFNFYSQKRKKKFPHMSRKDQKTWKINMEEFGKNHLLDNLAREQLESLGFLNENGEANNQILRKSALYQIVEHASQNLEVLIDGSIPSEWEIIMKKLDYIVLPFGDKTKLVKKSN